MSVNNASIDKHLKELEKIKKGIDRNELFALYDIMEWVYEKHNLKMPKNSIFTQYVYLAKKIKDYKKCVKKRDGSATRNYVNFDMWENNRKLIIKNVEKFKNMQYKQLRKTKNTEYLYNVDMGFGKGKAESIYKNYARKGSWFFCLDYFFTHIKEYKVDKRMFDIEWEQNTKTINTEPNENERLYIMYRIVKNARGLYHFLQFLEDVRKDGARSVFFQKQFGTKKLFYRDVDGNFAVRQLECFVYSLKQIKAMLWIRDNYSKKYRGFNYRKYETERGIITEKLREFVKNVEGVSKKYDCEYTPNKTYRSLWM